MTNFNIHISLLRVLLTTILKMLSSTLLTCLTIILAILVLESISNSNNDREKNEQDCYSALHVGGKLEQCVTDAKQKWNLKSHERSQSKDASLSSSCCAMYEALNCVQNHSCTICPDKDLPNWAAFRIRAINALGKTICHEIGYQHCRQSNSKANDSYVMPLDEHCANEPNKATESSGYKMAIILSLVVIVIIILVAVLGLIIHLVSHDSNPNKTKSTHSPSRVNSIKTNRFIPVNSSLKVTATQSKLKSSSNVISNVHSKSSLAPVSLSTQQQLPSNVSQAKTATSKPVPLLVSKVANESTANGKVKSAKSSLKLNSFTSVNDI